MSRSNTLRSAVRAPRSTALTVTIGALLAAFCAGAACNPKKPKEDPAQEAQGPRVVAIDLYAFGRQLGAIAPCGCTTDPLGGLQYALGILGEAPNALVIQPGSLLYPHPDHPEYPEDEAAWAQADERAKILSQTFAGLGERAVVGLGPTDVASPKGAAALETFDVPRVLGNIAPTEGEQPDVEQMQVVDLGHGLSAAATVIVAPDLAKEVSAFPKLRPPVAALEKLVPEMREHDLVVVAIHGSADLAKTVANEVEGIDVIVLGGPIESVQDQRLGRAAIKVGGTYIVQPGEQGQTLSHLRLTLDLDKTKGKVPRAGTWTLRASDSVKEEELARVEKRLAKFKDDPEADTAFISNLERERDKLKAAMKGEEMTGESQATFELVKVNCHGHPSDKDAMQALDSYDAWVAEKNKKRFAGVKTPEPAEGEPGYVGMDECDTCHEEAVVQWKTTVHASAYETLVVDNKQFDLSCVGCHVTGFREPSGAEVVETRGLVDVQCEQCHGPGSLHIEDPETKPLGELVPEAVCLECHTPEHSDTFDYTAYLRDILGEGHGKAKRDELGDGPTGAELRAAGLAKAGGSCKKM